ncbi:fumarylacetoacetate hydrolase family protein [Marinicrinis lubricantis]|uniref:Fumarylacetoacetate hydrolase family protein n=1 Tax=Marinicrinis lubricantis TaxID=2086470 RepID=A0ABW1IL23_9BACL
MKLLTIQKNDRLTLGVQEDGRVYDIEAALKAVPSQGVTTDMMELIHSSESMQALQGYVQQLKQAGDAEYVVQEENVQIGPCVPTPGKIICVGLNYRKHAEETNAPIPEYPILFNKFSNTIAAPGEEIPLPKVTNKVDYEAELTIVMGKEAKYVSKDQALDYVFGYCNVNDLSARDLQMRTHQWLLGKSCDKFSPIGPYLVTADEVGNPNQLDIKCIVNGEVRQHSNTSDMIFYCDEIVSYISQHMTLSPGDIILTGTPSGVVLGYPEDQQVYLQDGDIVTIEIEKLGALTNRMVAE